MVRAYQTECSRGLNFEHLILNRLGCRESLYHGLFLRFYFEPSLERRYHDFSFFTIMIY